MGRRRPMTPPGQSPNGLAVYSFGAVVVPPSVRTFTIRPRVIRLTDSRSSPFSAASFTVQVERTTAAAPQLVRRLQTQPLRQVDQLARLAPGTFYQNERTVTVCWDLEVGSTQLDV